MKYRSLFITIFAVACAVTLVVIGDVQLRFIKNINPDIVSSPQTSSSTAIVLGASVKSDHTPSDALRDRLLVSISLYHAHAVQQILVSGDDGGYRANEVQVMKQFLIENGIPAKDILTDGRGYRTYETCKRAVSIYHLSSAILITQRFHMARSLYLCNRLGLPSIGETADLEYYRNIIYFWIRDLAASVEAWWDINITSPQPPVAY